MKILMSINDDYVEPAIVLLGSLFCNTRNNVSVFFLESNLSESGKKRIRKWIHRSGHKVKFVSVGKDIFKDAPKRENISDETYYRLLAFEYLPKIEKVLYLDADMVVDGSLDELWDTDMTDYCVAGVADQGSVQHDLYHRARIGLKKDSVYVNGGVLLLNLEKMRQTVTIEKIFEVIRELDDKLWYQDQDLINILFEDAILELPAKYNAAPLYRDRKDFFHIAGRGKGEKPAIIHYFGALKPWKLLYGHKYLNSYSRYVKLAHCRNLQKKIILNQLLRPLALAVAGYRFWHFDEAAYYEEKQARELKYFWDMNAGGYGRSLREKGYSRVAVYGYGFWGRSIIHELMGSEIDIACVIDKYSDEQPENIHITRPEEIPKQIDIVIVTVENEFVSIAKEMEKFTSAKILSLVDFVYGFF